MAWICRFLAWIRLLSCYLVIPSLPRAPEVAVQYWLMTALNFYVAAAVVLFVLGWPSAVPYDAQL